MACSWNAARFGVVAFLVSISALCRVDASEAQQRFDVRGMITEADGNPLSGATVEVLDSYWSTISRPDGGFRLSLPSGTWQLRIAHIGYRADTLSVVVGENTPEFVRAALTLSPVELRGLTVESPVRRPLTRTVTTETVRQVPPLGEPDIFRALVLLPSVAQPNDLKGRIHLAGGASDETGIHLDDHPLQDPFHLLGLFGAFNVAALDRADVLVHHLPPNEGGRLSGVIDLETRRPEASAAGEAVLSLLTSGATVSQPDLPGGLDALVSGRVTYLDRVAPMFTDNFPRMGFHDGLIRLGRSSDGGWRTEVIGFTTRDRFQDDDITSVSDYEPFTWGESLAGVRLRRVVERWDLGARASFNRAFVHLDERPAGGTNHIDSQRDWISGGLSVGRIGRRWRMSGGVALDHRVNRQRWIARGLIDEIFSPSVPPEYDGRSEQTVVAGFWSGAINIVSWLTAEGGTRVSTMGNVTYVAPRASLSITPMESWRVEGAFNRRHQFDAQLEEPIEGSITAPLFLLPEPRTADVSALSAIWSPAGQPRSATNIQAQVFAKSYPDLPRLPPRTAGLGREEIGPDFPRFERHEGYAWGTAVSGSVTFAEGGLLQGSYSYQRVQEEFEGAFHPTAWDAPHTLALFASIPVWRGWNLNVVNHAHSGRATTPVVERVFEPDLRGAGSVHLLPRYIFGERNSVRVPSYNRLDLGTRKSWTARGAEWTLSLQVLNALNRENPVDYDFTEYFDSLQADGGAPRAGRGGLPVMPSIAVEVKW